MSGSTWAVVVFLALVSVQRLYETYARRPTLPGERKMRWSHYAFAGLHVLIFGGALVEHLALRRSLVVGWTSLGLLLYLASLLLRNIAIRTLGKFWSLHIEIRPEHQLVRQGIYNVIRHPAYAAIVLEVLAVPLTVNAWWTMLFAAVSYVPLLLVRLRREEQALVEKLGDAYRQYQRDVGALLPRWSALCKCSNAR
jgi:protein-S-isoprenylcysteine O-methyltransferase Ste14